MHALHPRSSAQRLLHWPPLVHSIALRPGALLSVTLDLRSRRCGEQLRHYATEPDSHNDRIRQVRDKLKVRMQEKVNREELRKKIQADVARAKKLRATIKADVERAKELVNADVERARELALHQVVNVPNVITMTRIFATPYLGYLIWDGSYTTAIGVLAVAGLSDWLDGFLARKLKQESIIGSFLDPFADKLMIGTLSLSMLASGLLPWPLVGLVFGRDFLLMTGTFYHRLKTKTAESAFFDTTDTGAFQVAPSMISKVNTALQFGMFGFALTNAAWQVPADPMMNAIFGLVGTTTFVSGSEYLWSYINKTGAFRPLPPRAEKEKDQQQQQRKE